MKSRKGKWLPTEIAGCMTLVPIFQCSKCRHIQSGYLTTEACTNCGSVNTVDKTKNVEIDAISKILEQLGN
jgi:hypothetical protein